MDPHAIFMDHFRIVTDPSHLAAGRRAFLMLGLSTFLNRSPEDDHTADGAAVPVVAGGCRGDTGSPESPPVVPTRPEFLLRCFP